MEVVEGSRGKWGAQWRPEIPYSRGYECLECGWAYWQAKGLAAIQCIVGFSPVAPTSSRKELAGVLIIECQKPGCGEKFWLHTSTKHLTAVEEARRVLQVA